MVTSSPSRNRRVGAGIDPLIVVAIRVTPVKFTGISDMTRLISVPLSTGGTPLSINPSDAEAACNQAGVAASTPPRVNP